MPDKINPTGLYQGVTFRPFLALFGSVLSTVAAIEAITAAEARRTQVTNVMCPAPNSSAFPFEAAANACFLLARTSQNSPHLDIAGQTYPDMPVPADSLIGDMANYENRDRLVKAGSSTVDLVGGRFQVQDFITTYRPVGVLIPSFRFVRNLMIDFNITFTYRLNEEISVRDHVIADDDQVVTASRVIKPKSWIQIVRALMDDFSLRALIVNAEEAKASIVVRKNTVNPDRLDTTFAYTRSSTARIASTDAEVRLF